MRVYNSIILSGLLVAGFASNLKSFEDRSAQKLQEFNIQQHLVADAEDSTDSLPIPHRGSGRFSANPKNTEQSLTKGNKRPNSNKQPYRSNGRFIPDDLAPQDLLAKDKEKPGSGTDTEPSRGSGRLNQANLTNA